uniref:WG repeat-containing protein n=1 Tax=candidate division WOR-3 bacterium TaxID=2052148 RepID=A0A7V4E4H2_UNCW3
MEMKKYLRLLFVIIFIAFLLTLFLTTKKKKYPGNCFQCGYLTLEVDSFTFFSEGLIPVKTKSSCPFLGVGDKWGYIDKKGELIIPPLFDSAGMFNQGKALVKIGDKYYYIDKKGRLINY